MTKDPETRALEILEAMPNSMTTPPGGKDREPLAKRILTEWIEREHIELDQKTLEALTRYYQSGRAAWEAAAAARRARHEALGLDSQLQREDEIAARRHETEMLQEEENQNWLKMGELVRKRVSAKMQAQIRKFELRYRVSEQPQDADPNPWEALLVAWMGDVTGGEDFENQTDEWLADFRERRRAQVPLDDSGRGEKLSRIEAFIEELRKRRDQMMRDRWRGNG